MKLRAIRYVMGYSTVCASDSLLLAMTRCVTFSTSLLRSVKSVVANITYPFIFFGAPVTFLVKCVLFGKYASFALAEAPCVLGL